MGKLATKALKEMLRCIKTNKKIVVPPAAGFDSGVHKIDDDRLMVVTTDPCLGVPQQWFGWFLIHYAASDLAVFGVKPEYAAVNLLGPPKTSVTVFKRIMQQACRTADELGVNIITGHTGTYGELSSIVGTCTAYGFVHKSKLITPAGAKPKDRIICVKPIGLETLINFALMHQKEAIKLFGTKKTTQFKSKIKMQTCVNEAILLSKVGGVHAMHDATEGGFVAALNEIADASNLGFPIDFARLPITKELQTLARHFGLSQKQLMSASSTGTLLAAVSPEKEDQIHEALAQQKTLAKTIGSFTKNKARKIKYNGKTEKFPSQPDDPYSEIMSIQPS
ncbi:MAG: AIR synthase-related protein [Candidatus Bathyarchaeia archaeon]